MNIITHRFLQVKSTRGKYVQSDPVGKHGNQLSIGGSSPHIVNGIAKIRRDHRRALRTPRRGNDSSDPSLHTRGTGAEFRSEGGINDLGHGTMRLSILYGYFNRPFQIRASRFALIQPQRLYDPVDLVFGRAESCMLCASSSSCSIRFSAAAI